MATGTKNFVLQKVIDPLRPIIDPIGKKAAQIGQALMDLLMKIPGIDKGLEILKKKGIGSFGDIAQAGSKLGKRAAAILPVVGGLVNLAFAYERAASGDSIGALIEGIWYLRCVRSCYRWCYERLINAHGRIYVCS